MIYERTTSLPKRIIMSGLLTVILAMALAMTAMVTSPIYNQSDRAYAASYQVASEYDGLPYSTITNCVEFARYKVPSLPGPMGSAAQMQSHINSYTPQAGAIAIYSYQHVSYVESVSGNTIVTLNGGFKDNQGNFTGHIERITGTASELSIVGYWVPANVGHNPEGAFDACYDGEGQLYVSGWALDRDDPSANLAIHVYVGDYGDGNTVANVARSDVNEATGVSGNHGFSRWITVPKRGQQTVNVYAINVGGGTSNALLGTKTVTILEPKGNAVSVEEGTYAIRTKNNQSMVVDIAGASTENNANVQLASWNDTNAQKFTITPAGDGSYYLIAKCSGKAVEVTAGSTESGQNIAQYTFNQSYAQRWFIDENTDGTYTLRNRNSGLVMDCAGGAYTNGTNIDQYTSNGTNAQKFYLDRLDAPTNVSVAAITINPSSYSLAVGESRSLQVSVRPSNATDPSIDWSTSNKNVATVSNGVITAVSPGNATITATAHDGSGVSATCEVEVVSAAVQKEDQVLTGTSSYTKTEGDASFALDAALTKGDGTLSYVSSDPTVASVDASGNVAVGQAGTAIITVTASATDAFNEASMDILVTVQAKPNPPSDEVKVSSILLDSEELQLEVGQSASLSATVIPSNATNKGVTWVSSNKQVASVSSTGEVLGIKAGTTTVKAVALDGSGVFATCEVEVVPAAVQKEDQVLAGTPSYAKTEGDASFALDAALTKGDGTLSYVSSDPTVASVDASGNVAVGQAGTAIITVTASATDAFNEASMDILVTVQAKPNPPSDEVKVSSILLDSEELQLEVGQSASLSATVIPSNATNKGVTWVSSNKQIASVSLTGEVLGIKAGTTTVKAVALDGSGVTASCAVTVKAPAGTDPQPDTPTVVKATPQVVLAKTSFTYDGGLHRPTPTVKVDGKVLSAANYTYSFDQGCINVGTYTVRVTLKNGYEGSGSATYKIVKAANPLVAQAKSKVLTVKYAKVQKKAQTIKKAKAFVVSGAQGAVSFKKAKGNKKITVSKAGKVTVKKGLKAGTYKVKVEVTAAGNANYDVATKTVTLKIKVAKGSTLRSGSLA